MFSGWTDETILALKVKWFTEAKSGGQIARELGTTRNAVISKINRLPPDPLFPARATRPARARSARRTRVVVQAARELEAEAAPPAPTSGSATLEEVSGSGGCLWPFGDGPYTFCAARKCQGSPYCAGHSIVAYQKVKPS